MFTNIHVNFRSNVPITKQIIEQIQHLLASGVLKPGDRLPTVRALAFDLGINFNTVARAYRLLDDSGMITTQRGRGTYALEFRSPEIFELLRQDALNSSSYRFLRETQQLGFSRKEAIAKLRKLAEVSSNGFPEE